MMVVVTNVSGAKAQINLPEETAEQEIPAECWFSALGELPNHCHTYSPDCGRTVRTIYSFVARDRCRRCL